MMGGRAAELLVFNHLTTGAANDIEQATNLARRMVCEFGMSERSGPLTFGKKEEMVFLGKEIATQQGLQRADRRGRSTQKCARSSRARYKQALQLLEDNIDKLHLLANTLLEREVLDGEEMNRVLRGEKLEPLKPPDIEPTTEAPQDHQAAKSDEPAQLDAFNAPPAPRPAGA